MTGSCRRVAIVSHSRARVGGVETYLASVVPALRRAGYEVGCWFETAGADADPVIAPDDGVMSWVASADSDHGVAGLAAWKPDVVYGHGVVSPAHERATMQLAPAVFFAHSYYGACISGTKSFKFPVMRPCERALGPGCLAQYYPRGCGGWSPLTLARQYRLQRDRLELLAGYARILVASRHMADEYGRQGLAGSVRVVPLPVEAAPFETAAVPLGSSADAQGPWRLLFLGRFEETKGAHIALESAALVAASTGKSVDLQLSGEGSWRGRLTGRAAALTARDPRLRVTVTPWLTSAQTSEALQRADLLLVPSLWPEPFGLVGVEAARRGVPAIAFAVGGIPEWLIDGVTGMLVPTQPPTAERFAAAVVRTLSDTAGWQRMRAAGPGAAARFGVEAHVRALESVFAEVSGDGGLPQ
jgi:glycosyltransferase involved in cell wall biosynthesis